MTLWGLHPEAGIWLGGHAVDSKRRLHLLLIDQPRSPIGPIEAGFITPASVDEAIHFAQKLSSRLGPGKRLWILIPCNHQTDKSATWRDLDNRMFEQGFTKIASVDVDELYQTIGYTHTSIAYDSSDNTHR